MWKQKLKENKGSTLPELLMTVLIIALIGSALTGGLVVVQRCYRRITELSHAETLLSTTATLLTDQLEYAVSLSGDGDSFVFVNANSKASAALQQDETKGIYLSYRSSGSDNNAGAADGKQSALVSEAGLTDSLYTGFDSISYQTKADGRAEVTIRGLAVYRKSAAADSNTGETGKTAAAEDISAKTALAKTDLVVRTVNRVNSRTEDG